MPVSKANQRAVNKYVKNNYDRINVTMPKGKKDIIQAHAETNGQSVNSFINEAIDEKMKPGSRTIEAPECSTTVQMDQSGILAPETLKTAQEAAQAAGETPLQFIARAVETQAQRDKLAQKMKASGETPKT